MGPLFYSTGQAARELGITQARLRDLCRNSVIRAEMTPGGQFRIPREVIEKLKREGVPALPKPLPQAGHVVAAGRSISRAGHFSGLLAAPSDDVIDSAEEVVCLENEVKSLGLQRQKEEQLDWFREREDREAERAAQRQELEEQRQAQLAAEQLRQDWRAEWLEYGLNELPARAPQSARLDLHAAVVQALERLDPSSPDSITLRIVDAAVDRALTPWRAATQKSDAIQEACESYAIPWDMRHDSTWRARMNQAASVAVSRLRDGASLDELKTAADHAVAPLVREYEHGNTCGRMVNDAWMKLSGETSEERERAKEAVRTALEELPIGASNRQMELARDNALEPIRRSIAAREDLAMRKSVLQWVGLSNRFGALSREVQQKAMAEIKEAFNRLPVGTARAVLDETIDTVVNRYYSLYKQHERDREEAEASRAKQQEKRRSAEVKASQYLNHIEEYLREEFEFRGGYFEMRREAERLREPIREGLIAKLLEDPHMEAAEIRACIEDLAEEHL